MWHVWWSAWRHERLQYMQTLPLLLSLRDTQLRIIYISMAGAFPDPRLQFHDRLLFNILGTAPTEWYPGSRVRVQCWQEISWLATALVSKSALTASKTMLSLSQTIDVCNFIAGMVQDCGQLSSSNIVCCISDVLRDRDVSGYTAARSRQIVVTLRRGIYPDKPPLAGLHRHRGDTSWWSAYYRNA